MTREQQRAYNAENYPASVLTWLNEATDRAFDECEKEIKELEKQVKYWKLSFNKQVEASRS